MMASSGNPGGLLLLWNRIQGGGQGAGATAQATIAVGPFQHDAAVFAAADGTARYQGPSRNAGIILTIKDGPIKVMDDSFEGESSNIGFRSAASHMFVLPKGKTRNLVARVDPSGAGGANNTDATVNLSVMALAVN